MAFREVSLLTADLFLPGRGCLSGRLGLCPMVPLGGLVAGFVTKP